jgi:hypothetical protein
MSNKTLAQLFRISEKMLCSRSNAFRAKESHVAWKNVVALVRVPENLPKFGPQVGWSERAFQVLALDVVPRPKTFFVRLPADDIAPHIAGSTESLYPFITMFKTGHPRAH